MLLRVLNRCRAGDECRLRAIVMAETLEPSQNKRDMRTKHSLASMTLSEDNESALVRILKGDIYYTHLIDNNILEALQEGREARV